jgi:hypothetical protein
MPLTPKRKSQPKTSKLTVRETPTAAKHRWELQQIFHLPTSDLLDRGAEHFERIPPSAYEVIKSDGHPDEILYGSMFFGGFHEFREDLARLELGGQDTKGVALNVTPKFRKTIEDIKKHFPNLNQSARYELILNTLHRVSRAEIILTREASNAIANHMTEFLAIVKDLDQKLDEYAPTLIEADPSGYLAERYMRLKNSDQDFKVCKDEEALRRGLDGLQKTLLNFSVIKNIAEEIMRDCQANQRSIQLFTEDADGYVSWLSQQGGKG